MFAQEPEKDVVALEMLRLDDTTEPLLNDANERRLLRCGSPQRRRHRLFERRFELNHLLERRDRQPLEDLVRQRLAPEGLGELEVRLTRGELAVERVDRGERHLDPGGITRAECCVDGGDALPRLHRQSDEAAIDSKS